MSTIVDVNAFEVGWVCALSTEFVAACELLDEEYEISNDVAKHDANAYMFGRIGAHKIVISCLPKGVYGTTSAASVARDMMRSFPSIRFGLMVGIGGGAPSKKNDIRLGDIVVGCPSATNGGVINIQYGKNIQGGDFEYTGSLAAPPRVLLSALNKLIALHERKGHKIQQTVRRILTNPRLKSKYSSPGWEHDHLFSSQFLHQNAQLDCEVSCMSKKSVLRKRAPRHSNDDDPQVHYGVIASSDNLMKNAEERDALIEKYDVLCFEMEAAGLMDHFPCLVIRGICDYSDTHKNKKWQGYAAAVAAAYAKELLDIIPSTERIQPPLPSPLRQYHGLFALHKSQSSCQIDVIAVHGLGGGAVSTWKTATGFSWLRDWLSKQSDVSILTYGYDSALTWDGSQSSIHRTATELLDLLQSKRPGRKFVFLCHGLGGVIVRAALGLILSLPHHSYLRDNILGLIFLGTPQQHLHVHELWRIIYRMSNVLLSGKPYRLAVMEKVEQISAAIYALSSNNLFDTNSLPILSFYETIPMTDVGLVIVEPEAVIMASALEEVLPVRADHIVMSAPDSWMLDDRNNTYVSIAKVLADLTANETVFSTNAKLLEKLYSVDYELYSVMVPDAFPQTGTWLWELQPFTAWADSSDSGMFWVRAPPGYGKTVITKGLARDLKVQTTVHPSLNNLRSFTTLVYFFREETTASTSMVPFLQSILHQILLQHPQLGRRIQDVFNDFNPNETSSLKLDPYSRPTALWKALQSVLHSGLIPNVILVLDGLDEADIVDIGSICSGLLETLASSCNQSILKIFLTSRDNYLISRNLSGNHLVQTFDITPEHTSSNIDIFLENSITNFAEEQNVSQDIRNAIKNSISVKAEGMFLWAKLAWNHFHHGIAIWTRSTISARLEALEDLPPGLPQLYTELLQKIDEKVLLGLHTVFLIIIAAARPITCEEIEQMLGIRGWELRTSDLEVPFSIRATISIYCANLLKIDSAGVIRVVHLSLKDFLRASVLKQDMKVLHRKIASDCIHYLTLSDIREEAQSDVKRSRNESCLLKRFPFYDYAATYLRYHLTYVDVDDHLWLHYASMVRDYAAFHVTASSFHAIHVNALDLKAPDFYLFTPLRHAIKVHGVSLIQSFAEQRYNLDEIVYPDGNRSDLYAAAAMHVYIEQIKIVSELLKYGASPNTPDYCERTVLHEAIYRGYHKTSRFLLANKSINVNAQDREGRTPLHYEATSGRGSILLNDPRVDVDIRDKMGRTPVTTAAFWGDHSTTIAFLRSARNSLAQHEGELSILITAAAQNWEDITSNILDHLPDVSDHRGYDGKTILHWAVINDWEGILVQAISQAQARVNDIDKRKRTPLHEAAERGNAKLAQKLIDLGGSVRHRDFQGRTPIHLAAIEGFSDTVLTLLDSDFDINDADYQHRTLVHWAASWDWTRIMRRILEVPGANLLKHDHLGRTVMHVAALCGCPNVLSLLIDQDLFNVNEKDSAGNTILHLAARCQSLSVLKVILSTKSFTKARSVNKYDQTALEVAYMYRSTTPDDSENCLEIAKTLRQYIPRRRTLVNNSKTYYNNISKREPKYEESWRVVTMSYFRKGTGTIARLDDGTIVTLHDETTVRIDAETDVTLSKSAMVTLEDGTDQRLREGTDLILSKAKEAILHGQRSVSLILASVSLRNGAAVELQYPTLVMLKHTTSAQLLHRTIATLDSHTKVLLDFGERLIIQEGRTDTTLDIDMTKERPSHGPGVKFDDGTWLEFRERIGTEHDEGFGSS